VDANLERKRGNTLENQTEEYWLERNQKRLQEHPTIRAVPLACLLSPEIAKLSDGAFRLHTVLSSGLMFDSGELRDEGKVYFNRSCLSALGLPMDKIRTAAKELIQAQIWKPPEGSRWKLGGTMVEYLAGHSTKQDDWNLDL
jgi:hypothetical protein